MKIDICICTFRRESVVDTLRSVAATDVPEGYEVRVIVADNDETPSAEARVKAVEMPFDVAYMHAPMRNISIARNACLDAADGDLLVFVDDDEEVTKEWLCELVRGLGEADVAFGPVRAFYGDDLPKWYAEEDYHSFEPVFVKGEIITGYTSNVIFKRHSAALKGLRFREELGQTGGEDTAFFSSAYENGAKMVFVKNALVSEIVPSERASINWLLKRKFRAGQTHAGLRLEKSGGALFARIKEFLKAFVKMVICYVLAAFHVLRAFNLPGIRKWVFRGTLHLGAMARLVSFRELKLYG